MALNIRKASEPMEVKQIISVVYGLPGVGKTSLAFTADNPLLLDFDGGAYRAAQRTGDVVSVSRWREVSSISPADIAEYDTVIVDTAGRALDHIIADLRVTDPGLFMGNGTLKLNGYGTLKAVFTHWLTSLKTIGKDVILIAHADEMSNDGGQVMTRIDMAGSSKNEVYKVADAMCRVSIGDDQRRHVSFSPTDTALGKDPGQLGTLEVPELHSIAGFWGDVTSRIKTQLNASTDELRAEAERLQGLEKSLTDADLDVFNKHVAEMRDRGAGPVDRKIVMNVARDRGFELNRDAGIYEQVVI